MHGGKLHESRWNERILNTKVKAAGRAAKQNQTSQVTIAGLTLPTTMGVLVYVQPGRDRNAKKTQKI